MKPIYFKPVQLPVLALTAVSGMALAGPSNGPSNQSNVLDTVVVTATRTAQTVDETLASVTVITREEIERRQINSVEQLLRSVPGISVANNGGRGRNTSVFLRGTESDHVLVLLDGVKIGSATSGTTAFQHLPIAEIERVEIVRGPRSALYGSEAIGGVIQIFTRSGGDKKNVYIEAGVGRYSSHNVEAGVSGRHGGTSYSVSTSFEETEGFNACNGNGGCISTEPDNDGYRSKGYSLSVGQKIGQQVEVKLNALVADGEVEFDSTRNNKSESRQQVLGLKTTYMPSDSLRFTIAAGQSRDESLSSRNGERAASNTEFNTERDHASVQADIALTDQLELIVGGDYVDDQVSSTTVYDESSRYTYGKFAQLLAAAGRNDFELSFRVEDNEQFGSQKSGGIAWGWAFTDALQLVASVGTAFKSPTFNNLYFPGFSNPTLGPETSRSAELALRGTTANYGDWSLSYFQTRVDNLIAYDAASRSSQNVSEARIQGAEATYSASFDDWLVNASLSFVDAQNRDDSANYGNLLPRRARYSIQFDADRRIGLHNIGASLYISSSRYNELANKEENKLGGYALIDLRAEWALSSDLSVRASVENAFDNNYQTVAGYNQGGRIWNLALRYQPQ